MIRNSCATLLALIGFSSMSAFGQEKDYTKPIVDKAIKALGDPAAQAKYKAISFNTDSKITLPGVNVQWSDSWSAQGHDRVKVDLNLQINNQQVSLTVTLNGKDGWIQKNKAPKEALESIQSIFRAVRLAEKPTELRAKHFKLSPLGEVPVGERMTVVLKVSQEGYRDISIYYDKKSGLPVKSEVYIQENANANEVLVTFTFSNFKEFGGVKHFTRIDAKRDEQLAATVEISNVELVENLGASTFAKP